MARGLGALRASNLNLKSVFAAIVDLFPPGTAVPATAFLKSTTALLRAERSALIVVKFESDHTALRVLDSTYVNASTDSEMKFDEDVRNRRAWSSDPIANRIHRRCARRPWAAYSYSTANWAKRLQGRAHESFSVQLLRKMGVKHEMTSLAPVDSNMYSLIALHRIGENAKSFHRDDRRLLVALHHAFNDRIIDLRARSLRQELPAVLHPTFTLMLAGKSEKEIARLTHRSPNTVHDHVKRIYQHFRVTSRGQLLSQFVTQDALRLPKDISADAET